MAGSFSSWMSSERTFTLRTVFLVPDTHTHTHTWLSNSLMQQITTWMNYWNVSIECIYFPNRETTTTTPKHSTAYRYRETDAYHHMIVGSIFQKCGSSSQRNFEGKSLQLHIDPRVERRRSARRTSTTHLCRGQSRRDIQHLPFWLPGPP